MTKCDSDELSGNAMNSRDEVGFFISKAFELFYCDETSSEEDEEEDREESSVNSTVTDAKPQPKMRNYVLIDNTLARNDGEFKAQFRMNRSTIETLCTLLESFTNSRESHMGRPSLPMQTQLLICIWVLTTQESYREVSVRFDVAKSSAIKCVHTVCTALLELAGNFVTWPKESEAASLSNNFREMNAFPGVIGCIGRMRIPTKVFTNRSVNKKSAPFVVLQAVCDDKFMFTDCYAGQVGHVQNDDFHNLYNVESFLQRSPDELFYGKYHLLGDDSYPISPFLLTPYNERLYLTKRQLRYNTSHLNTKCTIDRAFELLGARFRRLNFIDMNVPQMIRVAIVASCVLHNFCLIHNDHAYQFLSTSRDHDDTAVPLLDVPNWSFDEEVGMEKRVEIERLIEMKI